jgi:hypothetical protein
MTLASVPSGRRTPTLPPPLHMLLAPSSRSLSRAKAGGGGARSARRACRPPGRAKASAGDIGGDGARSAPLPLRAPPARPSQGRWWRRLWWWSSRAAVFDPSGWNRPATTSHMLQNSCFKCFIGMLQVFHMDVAKENQNVACIAMVVHISCKLLFPMFIYFSDICCKCVYLDVAYVLHIYCKCGVFYNDFKCFSVVFASISSVFRRLFI